MIEKTLPLLDTQVDSVLDRLARLQSENLFLKQKVMKLTQERAALLNMRDTAIADIKRIIKELKGIS